MKEKASHLPVGRVLKGIAGFYTVADENGVIMEAKARGRLRREDELLVGDLVRYQRCEEGKCTIEEILPRTTVLKRPYIANVTQILLVFALKNPDYNTVLIDRFLVLAEAAAIPCMIVFNKADLVKKAEAEKIARLYEEIGYKVRVTSTLTNQGKMLLKRDLREQVTVVAGPSGVGKSALLNMVSPGYRLKTGTVSRKIGRGRHTTRQVELLPLPGGGYVADTPGFTQIDLDFLTPDELPSFFTEFTRMGGCRFRGCLHLAEPGCSVKSGVENGKIHGFRYEHYKAFMQEIRGFYENRYK